MRKPNNYENTQAQGEFTPVELGGHTLVIKQVEERMSKTNKPMIVVSLISLQEISRRDILQNRSRMISVRTRNGRIRERAIF